MTTEAEAAVSADEMMTVVASRALTDETVCFVGIGLPSTAANLARLTHAPRTPGGGGASVASGRGPAGRGRGGPGRRAGRAPRWEGARGGRRGLRAARAAPGGRRPGG